MVSRRNTAGLLFSKDELSRKKCGDRPLSWGLCAGRCRLKESTIQLLYLMTEVSIATVALSGITMFIAASTMRLDGRSAIQISAQLRMAFVVTLFSVFPLFLLELDISSSAMFWRLASGLYLSGIACMWVLGVIQVRAQGGNFTPPILGVLAATTGLILLVANFWLVSAWPYILQLLIAWSVSLIIYLGFIQGALDQKVDNDRGT